MPAKRWVPFAVTAIWLTVAVLAVVAGAGVSAAEAAGAGPRQPEHVVLISIDGLRPEFYLDPRWPAPMLRQLRAAGSYAAAVRGVLPSITYPTHASLITGVRPQRHGVPYNIVFSADGTRNFYWQEEHIRVDTLWDAARRAGLKTASVMWPVSVGAPVDWNIPEVWSTDPGSNWIDTVRRASHPPGLLEEVERMACGHLTPENYRMHYTTRDERTGAMAAYLLETHRPHLMTVHLVTTDHFQHEDGRESPRVERAVAAADRGITQIWEAAERAGILDRTAFVIVGDHGHIDLHTRVAPNVWLIEAGLRGRSLASEPWRASFHYAGATLFLQLRDPGDHEAVARVREVLAARPEKVSRYFRVLDRREIAELGGPDAPLAVTCLPGIHVTDSVDGPAIHSWSGGTHGYLPDQPQMHTGLIASGAGIAAGVVAPQLEVVDVAPLVARLLGLELGDTEGIVPLAFLAD